jgi:hypothetical protein
MSKTASNKKIKKPVEHKDSEDKGVTLSVEESRQLIDGIKRIERVLSIKNYIFRGFWYGVANVIGATIGIALVFFVLGRALEQVNEIPILNSLISKSGVVKIVQEEIDKYEDSDSN